MSDDSYYWKSAADCESYDSQRDLAKMKKVNQYNTALLARLRQSMVVPNHSSSKVGEHLQKMASTSANSHNPGDKLEAQRQRLLQVRAMYM